MKITNQITKYYLNFFLLLNCFIVNAQTNGKKESTVLEKGSYYGEADGTKVKFNILDNNKFEFVFYEGTLYKKGDSINFDAENVNKSNYEVKFSKKNIIRPIVNLFIKSTMTISENRKFFVGTQKSSKATIEYKRLIETEVDSPGYISSKMNAPLETERMYALYLVTEDYGKTALIEKYIIPEDISDINIDFVIPAAPVKIVGKINPITGNFEMFNNREKTTVFSLNNNTIVNENVKPIEQTKAKNWTYPGKPKDESDYLDGVTPFVAKASDSATLDEGRYYKFKLKIEKSLKNALKENQKDKDKVLAIVYNQEADFKKFISDYEFKIGFDMYDKYEKENDYLNFYNATKKDKSELKKYLKKDVPCVIFVDNNGIQLFQVFKKISDIGYINSLTFSFREQTKPIVLQAQFDAVILNKKATIKQLIQAFNNINNFSGEVILPTENAVSDYTTTGKEIPFDGKRNENELDEEKIDAATKAIDAAATAIVAPTPEPIADEQSDYEMGDLKIENLYKFISTKEEVNKKWLSILEKQSNVSLNPDVIKIALDELDNAGFNKKLFKTKNTEYDFNNLDYILENFKEILKFKNKENDDFLFAKYDDLIQKSTKCLLYMIAENQEKDKEIFDTKKIQDYYKKLILVSENDSYAIKEYLEALKILDLKQEFVDTYDNYFHTVFKENSSLIEQLDLEYRKDLDSFISWKEFKRFFANDANNNAWQIILNNKDPESIKKAIKWSEASLIIDKTSHYYLDTLAQLYYKNGEKDKAIATQLKAIENIPKTDEESIKNCKEVLKKMKNGTY